jgi:hypothetical protein
MEVDAGPEARCARKRRVHGVLRTAREKCIVYSLGMVEIKMGIVDDDFQAGIHDVAAHAP